MCVFVCQIKLAFFVWFWDGLGRHWAGTGQAKGRHRADTGQAWSASVWGEAGIGQALGRHRAGTGQALGRYRAG